MMENELDLGIVKGGPGSGNFGHEGRPGEVGGSGEGGERGTAPHMKLGSASIPDGYIRLYHYTKGDPEKIREDGLKLAFARGETYGEPNFIWASSKPPDPGSKNIVEFRVKENDPFLGLESPERLGIVGREWMKGNYHVSLTRDIFVTEFIQVHEPWHAVYEHIQDNPKLLQDVLDGKKDNLIGSKFPEESRAILEIKRDYTKAKMLKVSASPYDYAFKDLPKTRRRKGGRGSGNFGHSGIPGHVGGSGEGGEGPSSGSGNVRIGKSELEGQDKPAMRHWEKENAKVAGKSEDARKVLTRLTDRGKNGTVICLLGEERDINLLASRGRLFSEKDRLFKQMQPNECHTNSANLFSRKNVDGIGTGFALTKDGIWGSHSWGLKGGKIVETTYKGFIRYFGVELKGKEAKAFVKGQKDITRSKLFPNESRPKKPWQHLVETIKEEE